MAPNRPYPLFNKRNVHRDECLHIDIQYLGNSVYTNSPISDRTAMSMSAWNLSLLHTVLASTPARWCTMSGLTAFSASLCTDLAQSPPLKRCRYACHLVCFNTAQSIKPSHTDMLTSATAFEALAARDAVLCYLSMIKDCCPSIGSPERSFVRHQIDGAPQQSVKRGRMIAAESFSPHTLAKGHPFPSPACLLGNNGLPTVNTHSR